MNTTKSTSSKNNLSSNNNAPTSSFKPKAEKTSDTTPISEGNVINTSSKSIIVTPTSTKKRTTSEEDNVGVNPKRIHVDNQNLSLNDDKMSNVFSSIDFTSRSSIVNAAVLLSKCSFESTNSMDTFDLIKLVVESTRKDEILKAVGKYDVKCTSNAKKDCIIPLSNSLMQYHLG